MRLHCLQHVPFENEAYIGIWAKENGHAVTRTLLYKGEEPPLLGSFEWLIVLGGPMGVYDEAEYSWLVEEKKFIKKAIATGKIVLGLCLGAQLISSVMGGKVAKNEHKEIGWFPITLTEEAKKSPIFSALPESFTAFEWHGDTFEIPPRGRKIASGEACHNQAFVISRAIGLQFHLEYTKESVELLIKNCGGDLTSGPYTQDASEIRSKIGLFDEANRTMGLLLNAMEAEYGKKPD